MKKIGVILWLMVIGLTACNLLDIEPQNSMIPVTVEDFEAVLLGGYPRSDIFMRTELATDNVYANSGSTSSAKKADEPWFVWAASHQTEGQNDAYWEQLYKSIFYANTVLDEFTGRTPAAEERDLFETVRGEAYALRAYCLFYLVNLYAEPWSEENLLKPGVPMPLTAENVEEFTQDNVRVPVGEVWEQIVSDLELATRDLTGKSSRSLFRFDYISLQAFKARVFLFMECYEEAVAAAGDVMLARSLCNMNTIQALVDANEPATVFSGKSGFIDTDYKNEVLFFVGGKANNNLYQYDQGVFKPTEELVRLCFRTPGDTTDIRQYIFRSFARTNDDKIQQGNTVYRMYATQEKDCYYIGIKLSEMYLIRAEAYARMSKKGDAIAEMNTLLRTRHKTGGFVDLQEDDFTNETLLQRILEERRLELAFDGGLRWFDLRRLGKPAQTHAYKGEIYNLIAGDLRYVLQIPESEIENSPNMPKNPR